jgi:hypothetical protein
MYFSDIFSITESDILNLITNKISEQKTLEFKRQLPEKNDETGKIKILQSIASFANTDGGIIIFGMKENEGEASEIVNIETSTDDDASRLISMIKDRISPRINPPEFRELIVKNKKIYIIYIHSSFTKPHYVNGNFVFYGRHNSGKYQLDIAEIRALFLKTKSVEEQFENFRINRIMKLKSHSFPFKYYSNNFYVIHIASLNSLNENIQLSMPDIQLKNIAPIGHIYATGDISNYDGYLLYDYTPDSKMYSYAQIFRNGSIETTHFYLYNRLNEKIIFGVQMEREIRKAIISYIVNLQQNNIPYPYFVSISLINTKGFTIRCQESDYRFSINEDFYEIFEEDLLLPTIFVENENDLVNKLKSCFEVFWNSNGYSKSPVIDKEHPHGKL